MPPEGSPCPDTPCQNRQEYGVPKTLTKPVPPLVSGEAQRLHAFIGLFFTALAAVQHSVDGCVAQNSYRNNRYTYDDWIVWHLTLYFFLMFLKLRTPNLFILPKIFRRNPMIELSKLPIIPLVFIRVNTKTKYQSLNSVPQFKLSNPYSLNNCGCSDNRADKVFEHPA